MALLNIGGLDDQLLTDAAASFAGGQNSFMPPDQLQANQSSRLVNIDISDGMAVTRRGAEQLGSTLAGAIQGLAWYDTPSVERLVCIENALTKGYDESSWANYTGYVPASVTAQVCMAQLIEKLYFADGTSNLFEWDGASLTDLGATTASPGNPPTGAAFVLSCYGRLWLAGFAAAPDTIWASYFLNAGNAGWNATFGNCRIGQGEGDPITGLAEIDGYQLVVFKRNSIYIVTANPATTTTVDSAGSLANASVTKVSDTIGCVSHRSIARVGPDVYFLSDTGVHSLRRVLSLDQREVDYKPLSEPIKDITDRINWQYAHTAAATFWQNRYFLSVPLDDETTPTTALPFNTLRQAWSGTWEGWNANTWALSKAAGNERLNFGRTDANVWRWLGYVQPENATETAFQDNGADYQSFVQTRALIFGSATNSKSAFSVRAEFFESDATARFAVSLDEDEPITLDAEVTTSKGTMLLPFTLPATLPSRGLVKRSCGAMHLTQFDKLAGVVSADSGKLALRGVIATGFINTIEGESGT